MQAMSTADQTRPQHARERRKLWMTNSGLVGPCPPGHRPRSAGVKLSLTQVGRQVKHFSGVVSHMFSERVIRPPEAGNLRLAYRMVRPV
jgi:hypothetical protein